MTAALHMATHPSSAVDAATRANTSGPMMKPAFDVQAFLDSAGVARKVAAFRRSQIVFSQGDQCTADVPPEGQCQALGRFESRQRSGHRRAGPGRLLRRGMSGRPAGSHGHGAGHHAKLRAHHPKKRRWSASFTDSTRCRIASLTRSDDWASSSMTAAISRYIMTCSAWSSTADAVHVKFPSPLRLRARSRCALRAVDGKPAPALRGSSRAHDSRESRVAALEQSPWPRSDSLHEPAYPRARTWPPSE